MKLLAVEMDFWSFGGESEKLRYQILTATSMKVTVFWNVEGKMKFQTT
jgi:hypothetical protein